ncbi:Y-family DNA polymerase [Roseibium sp.]|uniref:Y-family DNA polymerase n=1 Tax=Roseibium sp. TaxID=1936156 RepID=UPI003A974BBC
MLTHHEKNALCIYCLNEIAERSGIAREQSFADACALYPDLISDLADPLADQKFLAVLARWAERYCPIVSIDDRNGLLLDISGAAHLFGGEEGMVADLLARFERAAISARLGLADTPGAAWAVARFESKEHHTYGPHQSGRIVPQGQTEITLAPLPIAALRIDTGMANSLRRVGLSTIRDLVAVPRANLARRFGKTLLAQLDFALGHAREPVTPQKHVQHFTARKLLPEPIGLTADVLGITRQLLEEICETLEKAQRGARRLQLTAQRVDSHCERASIGLAYPMRDPARMTRLFAHSIDKMDAGYGIECLSLEVTEHEPLTPQQTNHLKKENTEDQGFSDLISSIGNRIGFQYVQRYLPCESHIPEKSFITVPVADSTPANGWRIPAKRPLTFFPPEPIAGKGATPPPSFRWRNMQLRIAYAEGPERIQPEWWQEAQAWQSGLRDYWRVLTREGKRLWLFHTPQVPTHQKAATWFVHGEFA